MKNYKVLKGYYKQIAEKIIEVPDDMVFLCNPKEIGPGKHDNHAHYLGITLDSSYKEGKKFGDSIILKAFNDIKPIDELPIISPEEAENRFHFTEYYVYRYTEGYIGSNLEYTPKRLVNGSKILEFNSEYDIVTCDVVINSWMPHSDIEVRMINKNNTDIDFIFNIFKGHSEITKDSSIFNEALNTVLTDCGLKIQLT